MILKKNGHPNGALNNFGWFSDVLSVGWLRLWYSARPLAALPPSLRQQCGDTLGGFALAFLLRAIRALGPLK
jgi:hypothetical protein